MTAKLRVLIGTGNSHKLKEITNILNFPEVEFISLKALPPVAEPEENGRTFEENALIKARYYFEKFQIPCLADDSGLEVKALDGKPGIYSSRFAGLKAEDMDNNRLLLKKLNGVDDTSANYTCVAAFVDGKNETVFEGKFYGYIGREFRGSNGFGYDPLFYFEHDGVQKSVAELTPEVKDKISHRAIAVHRFKAWFKKHLSENLT